MGRATPLLQLHAEDRLQPSAGKMLLLELDRNQTNAAKLAEKVGEETRLRFKYVATAG